MFFSSRHTSRLHVFCKQAWKVSSCWHRLHGNAAVACAPPQTLPKLPQSHCWPSWMHHGSGALPAIRLHGLSALECLCFVGRRRRASPPNQSQFLFRVICFLSFAFPLPSLSDEEHLRYASRNASRAALSWSLRKLVFRLLYLYLCLFPDFFQPVFPFPLGDLPTLQRGRADCAAVAHQV